jgi:hypothetical protein
MDKHDSFYYRVDLTGQQVGVSYDEIHALRKDILLYFDENLEEPLSILLADGQYTLPYWQYLSFGFAQEEAESFRYQRLVVEGCLALLNAIALDLLDEPLGILPKAWHQVPVEQFLAYLALYRPTSTRLATAKAHLVRTFAFIQQLTPHDLDEHNCLKTFDLTMAGKWFQREIVEAYFTWRVATKSPLQP